MAIAVAPADAFVDVDTPDDADASGDRPPGVTVTGVSAGRASSSGHLGSRSCAIDGDRVLDKPDKVVTEEPMEIRVHGPGQEPRPLAITMRTPGNDFELAVGFCLTEGMLDRADDLDTVAYCLAGEGEQEYNVVTVSLAAARSCSTARTPLRRQRELRPVRQDDARRGRTALRSRSPTGRSLAQSVMAVAARSAARRADACSTRPAGSMRAGCSRPTVTLDRAPRGRRPSQRARQVDRARRARAPPAVVRRRC